MGCKAEDYAKFLRLLFRLSDIHGALVTMPHKVTTVALLDEVLTTAKVAGSCNAVRLEPGGRLVGDMFDAYAPLAVGLAERLRLHYPLLQVVTGSADPAGFDVIVNATPLGMKAGDPLPLDVDRIAPTTFVGEVVMTQEATPFLEAARARGCAYQIGTDMLFEQIPAYLEFFGFPTATPDELRAVAQVSYEEKRA